MTLLYRLGAYAALLAGVFASGAWTGREWQLGVQARAVAAQEVANATRRAAGNAAEAARLADEAAVGFTLGNVADDALADPDAGLVSLGLRDAKRLNSIR